MNYSHSAFPFERTPLFAALVATALASATVQPAFGQTPPAPVINSPAVPVDVAIPQSFSGNPIAFFDDFSWRSLVAMVWPAMKGQRGQPDTSQTVGGSGSRVFETYKSLAEIFHSDGSAPSAWNSFDAPKYNPCNATVGWGDLVLGSFSKFSDIGQAGFGNLVGPLIAQNQTYTRFLTAYNQALFEQINSNKWYLRNNLPATITFQNGSLDVKSAWMDMTNVAAAAQMRYYTRMADVLDPQTGTCSNKLVGLVGLHIVQKTPSRPQWIWSTFEQIDNVSTPPHAGAPGPFGEGTFNYNDGKGAAMPQKNPYQLTNLPGNPVPPPFNVTRTKPIHDSTQATNQLYQAALKGTVWQNYQLVMTQWPLQPNSPTTDGTPANTFPGVGASTSFANATLETFDQASIFNTGCMLCHNTTRKQTDFLWSLEDHAFPATTPNLLMKNSSFRALKNLLERETPTGTPASQPK